MGIVGVLVAAAAGWLFGAAWYMALAKPWMAAAGVKVGPDGRPMGNGSAMPFVLSGIAMIVVAAFMRHLFVTSGVATFGACLVGGLGIGLFFITPWTMINNAYPGRPFRLTLIDGGYATFGCALMGAVLSFFL